MTLTSWKVTDFDTGLDEPKVHKPYCVSWDWGDYESFATFAEALAFRNAECPRGRISNQDNVDGGEFDGESGEEIMSDGLTEEESEAML